ncbi:class I SAM-dependent methyltransferase [Draconibacterium mangrovi]|uniref:class I SAM-dependent methyltransferase n=1 Tax=Draconibacterium mangrovi TaxID=2697469 RepID=UPI0013D2E613|nr:class I SAM-dependent methyltransferase [Draconibacterium mangrovi]
MTAKTEEFKNKGLCLLCNSKLSDRGFEAKDYLTSVEGSYLYKECSFCRSYIQTPVVSQAFLNHCYNSQSLTYKKPIEKSRSVFVKVISRVVMLIDLLFLSKKRKRTLFLEPSLPPCKKVLEIGCSYGERLSKLKDRGYDVTGIELAEESVQKAKELFGLNIINSDIDSCDFKENQFDVIIMRMVLEHLRNPQTIIRKISSWLREGGELLISVPAAEGAEFKEDMRHSYLTQAPYHIFIPTMEGLRELFSDNYKIVDYQYQFAINDLVKSAQFQRRDRRTLKNRLMAKSEVVGYLYGLVRHLMVLAGRKASRVNIRLIKL